MKSTAATSQRRARLRGAIRRRARTARLGQRVAIGASLSIALLALGALQAVVAFDRLPSALLAATIVGLVHAITWPLFVALVIHAHPSLSPLFAFALTAAVLAALGYLLPGVVLDNPGAVTVAALLLTIVHAGAAAFIALGDDAAYERFAIKPLVSSAAPPTQTASDSEAPGLLFVEIDGLAEPFLRDAIVAGHAPTIARWLESGRHRLIGWECDLAAQPAASQAGILHGDNFDIPAFRWYDKTTRTIVVSNNTRHGAAMIERQVSNGHGLLADSGASRGTLLSGDAVERLFTVSTVNCRAPEAQARTRSGLGRYGAARLVALFAWEFAGETGRLLRRARASFREIGSCAAALAFASVAVRELCLHRVIEDMVRGTSAVYLAYTGFDAAAHHSGVRSRAAKRALRRLDQQLALLELATRHVSRPYEVVVLSGQGQNQGPSLRRRFGQTLGQVVSNLAPDARVVVEQRESNEIVDTARALLRDQSVTETRSGRWLNRFVARGCDVIDVDPIRPLPNPGAGSHRPAGERDILVLVSGSLGLISFPSWPHRLTHEEITAISPHLIPGLVRHEGIGFVLVTSGREGATVIGAHGTFNLEDERIEGEDPLADYGPNAARHLRRYSLFTNCPDILVHGRYDRESGHAVSFEETVGSHGGLGGPQARPFLLYSKLLRVAGPLIGAPALYDVFIRWRRELATADLPAPVREQHG